MHKKLKPCHEWNFCTLCIVGFDTGHVFASIRADDLPWENYVEWGVNIWDLKNDICLDHRTFATYSKAEQFLIDSGYL